MLMMLRLVIVLAVLLWLWTLAGRVKQHGAGPLAWRWVSGLAHHGKPMPDSGRRFWRRPRHHRAAIRCAETAAVLVIAWGLLHATAVTLWLLGAAALAGLAYACHRAVTRVRTLRHRITWVNPAHLVAAPLLSLPSGTDPGSYLEIAPDRSRVAVELPPEWNGDGPAKARLVSTLTGKLGIESPEVKWALAGPKPRLEITQSAPPPQRVSLADVRAAIDNAKPDEIVWGLGKKRAVVKTSFGGDSPHVGLSMGSGAGKSELAKVILAQLLHKGAVGLILDHKMMSHPWVRGLPNVAVAVRPPEIHRALVWLGGEVQRRKEVAYASADLDGRVHATVGVRIIVIAEELNATVAQLRAYWRGQDEKGRSPALTALDEVSFTGRSVLINLVYIGQRLSDKATGGGGDARENIGVIAFARYRPSTWKMLAPDFPVPPKNNAPGRLQVVSDVVQETQAPLFTTDEARELALSGVVSPLPYGMPGAPATGEPVSRVPALVSAPDLGVNQFQSGISPAPVSPVTLRQAVEAGLLGPLTIAGARTARHRDETFPSRIGRDGLAELYDPAALAAWASSRREN